MKQICKNCGKEFKEGDRVKAVVLSIYHEISSHIAYAIDKPYECVSLEHVDCDHPENVESD